MSNAKAGQLSSIPQRELDMHAKVQTMAAWGPFAHSIAFHLVPRLER